MNCQTIELSEVILDIAAGPFGSNLKKSCFQESGFPIVDGANLKGFKLTDNITKFVTEEKARTLYRSIAKRNDVVVTISGTLGQISYIPNDSKYEEYLCSQRQFRVTFDEKKVYVPYLVFYFHTYEGQNKILSFANQVGVPALAQPLKNFKKITIDLPDISSQIRIAGVIEAINNKIDNNGAINRNLEEQISSLYKAWYIDFIPFQNTEFVETSMGAIPKGWTVRKVGDLCETVSVKHHFNQEKLIFLNTGDVENGMFLHKKYSDVKGMPGQAKKSIKKGDILYSEIRPINKHFAYVDFEAEDYVVSTKLMVIRTDKINSRRMYQYLTSQTIIDELQLEAESRSGTFPQIRFENVSSLNILIANDEVEHRFDEIISSIYEQIDKNNFQNEKLRELRDSILPKLMSGELEVLNLDI